jgi:hypothetical protein
VNLASGIERSEVLAEVVDQELDIRALAKTQARM